MIPKILTDNGTVTLPALAFSNDPDTGRFLNAAGDMQDVVAGAAVLKHAAGFVDACAGLKIGTGAEIVKVLTGTATQTFTVANNTTQPFTITVTGAKAGDAVALGNPNPDGGSPGLLLGVHITAYVGNDLVSVYLTNQTGVALTWTAKVWRATVFQF